MGGHLMVIGTYTYIIIIEMRSLHCITNYQFLLDTLLVY